MAMTLRTDEQLDDALDRLSAAEGISKQEVIRRAVLDRAQRLGQLDRALAIDAEIDDRWGGLLDRLGNA